MRKYPNAGAERGAKTMNGFKGQPEEAVQNQAFVVFKPKCGHCVGASVISADHAKNCLEFVLENEKAGFAVEIRSVDWAREHLHFCRCGEQKELAL